MTKRIANNSAIRRSISFIVVILVVFLAIRPLPAQPGQSLNLSNDNSRAESARQLAETSTRAKANAEAIARAQGWPIRYERNNITYELQQITHGQPIYFRTQNLNAGISTAANLIRNTSPYNVVGTGWIAGVWDAGSVLSNHNELTGRVFIQDGAASHWHSTHVGGTIGASGVVANAIGMATNVTLHSYEWTNVLSEMAVAAATSENQTTKIYVSNSSFGWVTGWNNDGTWRWYGVWGEREARNFGRYSMASESGTESWDALCYSAPYYLPFKSAGNDRSDGPPPAGTTFHYWNGSAWVTKAYNAATDPYGDGAPLGYDTMESQACAKNIMTVGAVNDAVSGGVRNIAGATMSTFSGWGPCDDGRIKPDVVGNGVDVYSCHDQGKNFYATASGTSMASPNVAGSAILLVDYYDNLFATRAMRSSTLKGLIIHTADDIGNPGPDFSNGWGLMNTKAGADHILSHFNNPTYKKMTEGVLNNSYASASCRFVWDGSSPIRATLCWTDPAAAGVYALDNATPKLVNDLDVRVVGPTGTTYTPFVLDRVNPANNATTGDNILDNVEQVYVQSPGVAGTYRVIINHKGTLTNAQQYYSLLLSGQGSMAVNQSPINSVPPTQTVAQGSTLVFNDANSNRISTDDLDALMSPISVTMTVTNGTIALAATTGLTFTSGANGTASMTFTGTLPNINTALNGMSYTPNAGFAGADILTILTDDQGNTGTGGSLSDSDTVLINVTGTDIISVSILDDSWALGARALGYVGISPMFALTNTGNVPENMAVTATNGANGWSLSAAAGLNAFRVEIDAGDDNTYEFSLNTGAQTLFTNVGVSATRNFKLRYSAPTSDTQGGGVSHDFTVTVTASKYIP